MSLMQWLTKTKTRKSNGDELTEENISSSIRKRKASESLSSDKIEVPRFRQAPETGTVVTVTTPRGRRL